MNRQTNLAGFLLIGAAITFWVSWLLMPDPGTTDTNHILNIVKQSRIRVISSVVTQIISSVSYLIGLFLLVRTILPKWKALTGITLLGIGAMGMCADAFFHLLAWFMTDEKVTIQQDVVQVMEFMQTQGLLFLGPLMLFFFIGTLLLSIGLRQEGLISKVPQWLTITGFLGGPLAVLSINRFLGYEGRAPMMITIGLFALGHALIGLKLVKPAKEENGQMEIPSLKILKRGTAINNY